jgi:hypothetical protein
MRGNSTILPAVWGVACPMDTKNGSSVVTAIRPGLWFKAFPIRTIAFISEYRLAASGVEEFDHAGDMHL